MRIRTRRIPAATAERLLTGAAGHGTDHRYDRLAAVLAASAAPARPAELAGRERALAGFRTATSHPALPLRRPSVIKIALLKLLTVKAAAVAAVAVGAGGVALAASTGTLPGSLGSGHANQAAPAASHAKPRPSAPDRDPGGNASPSPSLVGLCRAYTAGAGSEHGKALDNPAFGALIAAAGGRDKVDGYCAGVLADPTASASTGGRPDDKPNGGRPSDRPDRPTGKPSRSTG